MNKFLTIFLTIATLINILAKAGKLSFVRAYPGIVKIQNNIIYFKSGKRLKYSDEKAKNFKEKLENPSVGDMVSQRYPKLETIQSPSYNFDPGRYRNIKFFKILYGKDKKTVEKNLVRVIWLPKSQHRVLWFNKLQNAAKNLQIVSNELDKLPYPYKKYITDIAGTFSYRKIQGTSRLSSHSFGIAIDINPKFSNYWKWDKKMVYKNKIPKKIVDIFEKHGFIWGGRWFHYDTMHFEYRPELSFH